MKKLFTALILGLLLTNCALAYEFKKSDKAMVKSVLNKHNQALREHDIEKIKTFYASSYKSADGFNLDDLSSMLEKTYSAYKNIKYSTKVNSITTFDNFAIAQVTDKTSAVLKPDTKNKNKDKIGFLNGKSVYSIYLKKQDGTWEIIYDDILMEETSLKYGIANNIDINLSAPLFIKEGQEYDLTLKMDKPNDVVALASLSREQIVYPPEEYDEKFRKIPSEGTLERIVRANKNNLDEYAVASVGFTRVTVNEQEAKAKIEVLGMAYIMKRINMEEKKIKPAALVENN